MPILVLSCSNDCFVRMICSSILVLKMTHQRKKKSHLDCLFESCLICVRKADRQVSSQKNLLSYIVESILIDYENVKQFLPSGICSTCRRKEISKIEWPNYSNWLETLGNIPSATMSSSDCQCFVCVRARSMNRKKNKQKNVSRPQINLLYSRKGLII